MAGRAARRGAPPPAAVRARSSRPSRATRAAALEILARYEQACLEEARGTPISATTGACASGAPELAARLLAEESRLALGAKLAWVQYARRELKALG